MPRRITAFALVLATWCLPASPALAVQYDVDVEVEDEDDIYDLSAAGQISDSTREELLELLRDGVDLNSATREEMYALPNLGYPEVDAILEYRQLNGRIIDPVDLVSAGALTAEQLQSVAPFLVLRDPDDARPVSGTARAVSAFANGDPVAPPAFLQVNARGPHGLRGGFAAVTQRLALGELSWDASRHRVLGESPAYSVDLPKFHLSWRSPNTTALFGTFRIGFGQRLTLDNTSRVNPDGFYPDALMMFDNDLASYCRMSKGELDAAPCTYEEQNTYVTPDFTWREGFRGVAATVKGIELGGSTLAMTAFGSYQSRSIYQYELYDAARCTDPRDDEDEDCRAPPVFVRGADSDAAAAKYMYMTLPDAFSEIAAGGNATLAFAEGARLGVTGYFASTSWNVGNADLGFQEWSRYPDGGPFGAVGVDGAIKVGRLNAFLEVSRSFDSDPRNGGGTGVLQRTTAAINKKNELELALRYYDRGFANPYARPIAAADEFEGLRARNETGARLRYRGRPNEDWVLRGTVDAWAWPEDGDASGTSGLTSLDTSARADFVGWDIVKLSGWADYRNKDLVHGGRGQCYDIPFEENLEGDPIPCSGEFYRVAGKVRVEPFGKVAALALSYQHEWLDDTNYTDHFRQDSVLWVEVTARPVDELRLRLRARYLSEDIEDDQHLEESIWAYLSASWVPTREFQARLRYDLVSYLDDRRDTPFRQPAPEQRVRLELVSNF